MGSMLYCRLCGASKNNLMDLFKEDDCIANIKFKIRTKLHIVITECDQFSNTVCLDCVDKLQEFYSFTKTCQLNQIRLFEANSNDSIKEEADTSMCISECEEILTDGDVVNDICLSSTKENSSINNVSSMNENCEETHKTVLSLGPLNNRSNNCDMVFNQTPTNRNINSLNNKAENKIRLSKLMNIFKAIRVKSEIEKIDETEELCQQKSKEDKSDDGNVCFSDVNHFSYSLKRTNFLCEREFGGLKPKLFNLEIRNSQDGIIEEHKTSKSGKREFKKMGATETRQNEKYQRKVPPNDNYVKCIFCGEIFLKTEFAEEHMHLHTDDPELHKLILEHMSTQGTKIFRCDQCDAVFNRQLAIIEHKNERHKELKPIKCHLCDRKFPGFKRTRSHVRSAHMVKSFKCDMCSYAAKNIPDLQKHKLGVHSNEKIMCTICGKLFSAFHHNLKKHMETHSNTRSYKCDLCDLAYKTRNSLSKHRENIHFPVSIMCSLCGTISASKSKYKKHIYKCRRRNKKIAC